MIIENFEEKGLFIHGLNPPFLKDFNDGFYVTKDGQFFIRPSIFGTEKWVIVPTTPEIAMRINHERFEGNEEEVLKKLKEWKT